MFQIGRLPTERPDLSQTINKAGSQLEICTLCDHWSSCFPPVASLAASAVQITTVHAALEHVGAPKPNKPTAKEEAPGFHAIEDGETREDQASFLAPLWGGKFCPRMREDLVETDCAWSRCFDCCRAQAAIA